MPNIATVLKTEIARIARREVRSETLGLKKASAQFRSDIAALKRRILELEQAVKRLGKVSKPKLTQEAKEAKVPGIHFSAARLTAQRERLGLTAAELAKLLGVSYQSIHKWEREISSPRASQLALIATLPGTGKRAAVARLAELKAQEN